MKRFSVFFFFTLSFLMLINSTYVFSETFEPQFEVYRYKQFKIGYMLDNDSNRKFVDKNNNNVPDSIEDIAIQLDAAYTVFVEHYGFVDPLKSERNYDLVEPTYVDVELFHTQQDLANFSSAGQSKELKEKYEKGHQTDRTQNFKLAGSSLGFAQQSEFDPEVFSLKINLFDDKRVRDSGVATHEYFHLIQMCYTYFKNLWFIEGTANWSMDAVLDIAHTYVQENLEESILNDSKLKELRNSAYNAAEKFFKPLVLACNDKDVLPDDITQRFKYIDGSLVFKDNLFYGAQTIRSFFECLNHKEEEVMNQVGGFLSWVTNNGVLDDRNDPYILECAYEIYLECMSN